MLFRLFELSFKQGHKYNTFSSTNKLSTIILRKNALFFRKYLHRPHSRAAKHPFLRVFGRPFRKRQAEGRAASGLRDAPVLYGTGTDAVKEPGRPHPMAQVVPAVTGFVLRLRSLVI
jgi:hypothetical protein